VLSGGAVAAAIFLEASLTPLAAQAQTSAQMASQGLAWFSDYLTAGQIAGGEEVGRLLRDRGMVWHDASTAEMLADYTLATGDRTYVPNLTAYRGYNGVYVFGSSSLLYGENQYNDDKLWWALAMLRMYDVLGDSQYLSNAETIFSNVCRYWGVHSGSCGGGVSQTVGGHYLNAITNELFFQTAAKLARLDPDRRDACGTAPRITGPWSYSRRLPDTYLGWSVAEWEWFKKYWFPVHPARMNFEYEWPPSATGTTIPDGLDSRSCAPGTSRSASARWTYNQGPILGALLDLSFLQSTGAGRGLLEDTEGTLQQFAFTIAANAMSSFSSGPGSPAILTEVGDANGAGGCLSSPDCPEFKGVFMRYLGRLLAGASSTAPGYAAFAPAARRYLDTNANQIWAMRQSQASGPDVFPEDWNRPEIPPAAAYQPTETSALDAIIAAIPPALPTPKPTCQDVAPGSSACPSGYICEAPSGPPGVCVVSRQCAAPTKYCNHKCIAPTAPCL
jgi:predicted alpha-1,6-mannanase (GH76 family)